MKKASTVRNILAITVGIIVYVILTIGFQYLRSGEINWKGEWIISGVLSGFIAIILFRIFRPSPKEEKK